MGRVSYHTRDCEPEAFWISPLRKPSSIISNLILARLDPPHHLVICPPLHARPRPDLTLHRTEKPLASPPMTAQACVCSSPLDESAAKR
jgi:hypothetical protein